VPLTVAPDWVRVSVAVLVPATEEVTLPRQVPVRFTEGGAVPGSEDPPPPQAARRTAKVPTRMLRLFMTPLSGARRPSRQANAPTGTCAGWRDRIWASAARLSSRPVAPASDVIPLTVWARNRALAVSRAGTPPAPGA